MTNEAKARELAKCNTCYCAQWCNGIEGDCCDEFEHLLSMAEWKDKQLKEVCSRCEKYIALNGETCPWRLLEKTYCWEK